MYKCSDIVIFLLLKERTGLCNLLLLMISGLIFFFEFGCGFVIDIFICS